MTELHDALKNLGPVQWANIPQEVAALDAFLTDLFDKTQLIVDSVPIPDPDDAPQKPAQQGHGRASKASEVSLSSERPSPPPFGHDQFQKEWGKPMKIKPADNTLGVSVYKMSSKDSKGSWFARRSIHEGIGYNRFKKSMQMEFEKSLAEPGPPGTGNVRGIGGEERVEQIKRGQGNVEVYRLSAQFPGPTAARDFVTMLVTSESALKTEEKDKDKLAPRHYMVISRPCDHPKTQPQTGFVRGYYESVEFIREVPRKLKSSQSTFDLHAHQPPVDTRKRSATTAVPVTVSPPGVPDPSDPEDNPVEWIMITRSDPGGGIPRFLVERGTPGSICADAVKFVDWACQNDEVEESATESETIQRPPSHRRESHQSWRARSLVGVDGEDKQEFPAFEDTTAATSTTQVSPDENNGFMNTVAGAAGVLKPYTPQIILDRLPAASGSSTSVPSPPAQTTSLTPTQNDDARSITSATSFASAEDHWTSSSEDEAGDSNSSLKSNNATAKEQTRHEQEVKKLDDRREALNLKFASHQSRMDEMRNRQAQESESQTQKALDRHEKELKKHEEKFQKELAKIEQKQAKERKKFAERAKKQASKDENSKIRRERDEARQELELSKTEIASLRQIVADLQKENTSLVIKLGKAGLADDVNGLRSRGNTLSKKEQKAVDAEIRSASSSIKSS